MGAFVTLFFVGGMSRREAARVFQGSTVALLRRCCQVFPSRTGYRRGKEPQAPQAGWLYTGLLIRSLMAHIDKLAPKKQRHTSKRFLKNGCAMSICRASTTLSGSDNHSEYLAGFEPLLRVSSNYRTVISVITGHLFQ